MSSFELQTYKNGIWSIDSYYDDRELAISEAERLDVSGRHAGVRVLLEEYHEPTNTSNYQVIYSRLQKDAVKKPATSPSRSTGRASESAKGAGNARTARRPPPKEKSKGGSIFVPVLAAVLILIAGVTAMLVLQSDMDFGKALGSLVGSKPR